MRPLEMHGDTRHHVLRPTGSGVSSNEPTIVASAAAMWHSGSMSPAFASWRLRLQAVITPTASGAVVDMRGITRVSFYTVQPWP